MVSGDVFEVRSFDVAIGSAYFLWVTVLDCHRQNTKTMTKAQMYLPKERRDRYKILLRPIMMR
jgi:hypothetical protein